MAKIETNKYIRSQSMATGVVTNDDLICKDCKFRRDDVPTSFCAVFKRGETRKPNSVLLGDGCPYYMIKKR